MKQEDGSTLPAGLVPVLCESARDELVVQNYMAASARILRRPVGLDLLPGMELLQRPPDIPIPCGMTVVPNSLLPPGLKLPEGVEIVQIEPRFEYPPGLILSPHVRGDPSSYLTLFHLV